MVKAALAVAVLGYLIYIVDLGELARAVRTANPWWIAGAVALLPLNVLLEGTMWLRMVRRVMPGARPRQTFGGLMCGYALAIFTPARAGEYAGRAFYLHHPDKWELSAVVFAQHMVDLVAAALGGTAALLVFLSLADPTPETLWWGLAVFALGTAGTLTALALLPRMTRRILQKVLRKEALQRRVAFVGRFGTREALLLLGLALLRYAVYTSQFVLLIRALAPEAGVLAAYTGVALVFFAKYLIPPVTLSELGIREGAAVFFLGQLGVAEAAALGASLLLFGINLLLLALAGTPFVLRLRLSQDAEPAAEREAAPALEPSESS